jgi:hypothetical protein
MAPPFFLCVWGVGGGEGAWGEVCFIFCFFFFGGLYLCSGLGPLHYTIKGPSNVKEKKTFREFFGWG